MCVGCSGLTIQNEPENEGIWESCAYTAEQELAFFLDYLYPQLHSTHPALNFMFFDHNKDHALNWARVFYTNPIARQLVWGIAIHWYTRTLTGQTWWQAAGWQR